MLIIAAKNAFLKKRTGIEEYSLQLLRHLAALERKEKVVIYTNKIETREKFPLNFHFKIIRWPILWTQIGLSLKMLRLKLLNKSNTVLFIPAHVMPLIHPRKTIVAIHGLEYEYFPQYYSWLSRKYLCWSTRYAARHAFQIIAVSKNTKNDLIKLYGADPKKIKVIYHGANQPKNEKRKTQKQDLRLKTKKNTKYFLYLGRIELKKNVLGIIEAFSLFKEQPGTKAYKLVLAGPPGYGCKSLKLKTQNSKFRKDIILTGYVGDQDKWHLIKNAQALVFPSFYEGFGLPVLEAQAVGVPVIAGDNSSINEIVTINHKLRIKSHDSKFTILDSSSALLVSPHKPADIAQAMIAIASNKRLRSEMIRRGYENIKRFNWKKCARETLDVLKCEE